MMRCIALWISSENREESRAMKVSDMIMQAFEKKGFQNLREASKVLGISPEILRITMNKGYIPKDKTLGIIANKLGLDTSVLILAAHQEKVPAEVKGFFLSPSQPKFKHGKRKFPLSQEQCDYLEKIMRPEEIQMVRKYRQVPEEAKTQIIGYIDYMFASKRSG
jgi:lambda repressor-like predicted transcriptional regulator